VSTALPARPAADAPQNAPGAGANDPEKIIAELRRLTNELNAAVKRFQTHVDQEIALHDRAYRTAGGRRIPGADDGLIGGQADVVQAAIRKLFAARMISVRRPGYEPAALADFDEIQRLIEEARDRINNSNNAVRRLYIVSAKELSSGNYAEQKLRHTDLLKARTAAAEAAKRAFVSLPIALPGADSPEEQRDKAWETMIARQPLTRDQAYTVKGRPDYSDRAGVRFEEGKRITLINEHFCRVTLTDSGLEDSRGRHLFYQEEWVTRQGSVARTTGNGPAGIVVVMRWAVSVDARTGQHALLRQYEPREFSGDFNDVYELQSADYITKGPAPERAAPPTIQEAAGVVAQVERSREEINRALVDFRRQIKDGLKDNATRLDAENKTALDDELPNDLREKLFAIRGHLAGAGSILDPEKNVRLAIARAAGRVRELEALVAWVNGSALEQEGPDNEGRPLLDLERQCDAEIYAIRAAEREALAALPPEIVAPEGQLPALKKDLIVRMRGMGKLAVADSTKSLRQELWQIEGSAGGSKQVKRTINIVEIDLKSGRQIPAAREVEYYPMDAGDTLEQIYDENAAQ